MGKVLSLDKYLFFKRNIDGSKTISRKSPFSTTNSFVALEISSQFIGSARWLRDSLIKMDAQRQDLVARVVRNNMKIRNKKNDNRMSKEIANVMAGGGDTFIN